MYFIFCSDQWNFQPDSNGDSRYNVDVGSSRLRNAYLVRYTCTHRTNWKRSRLRATVGSSRLWVVNSKTHAHIWSLFLISTKTNNADHSILIMIFCRTFSWQKDGWQKNSIIESIFNLANPLFCNRNSTSSSSHDSTLCKINECRKSPISFYT